MGMAVNPLHEKRIKEVHPYKCVRSIKTSVGQVTRVFYKFMTPAGMYFVSESAKAWSGGVTHT
jgi:hypothetical protein